MIYDRQILVLLRGVGFEGMSIARISRNLYNANCSFFEQIDYDEIHKYVLSFVHKNSRFSSSLLEGTGKRGFYRINIQSEESQQLILDFADNIVEEEPKDDIKEEDTSLFLF